jgi:hypothetical protein
VTGEFVNVGLVLFAPRHLDQPPVLRFEFKERIGRLRGLFPDFNRAAFQSAIRSIRRNAKSVAKDIERPDLFSIDGDVLAVAHKIIPHDGSSMRWSDISTGVSPELSKTFERACHRMLSLYDRHIASGRTDEDIWRPVHRALVERRVKIDFESKVIIGDLDSIEFRHSWKNGKVHAYEPLSFDLADAERIKDKARKWFGHMSTVQIGNAEDFKAYFIVGQPDDKALLPAYEAAVRILKSAPSNPEVYEESEVDLLVDSIEDQFRSHIAAL